MKMFLAVQKKNICVIFLICFIVILLTGCGGKEKAFDSLEDYDRATLGVLTGSSYEQQTEEAFPRAKMVKYKTVLDMLVGLKQDEIDGFLMDEADFHALRWDIDMLSYVEEPISTVEYRYLLGNNENSADLKKELNEFIAHMQETGELERLEHKWMSDEEPTNYPDYTALEPKNGTIKIIADLDHKPFSYQKGDRVAGLDVEFLTLFAMEYGYGIEMAAGTSGAIVAGLESGKKDISCGGITETQAREEKLDCSDVYAECSLIMAKRGEMDLTLADLETSTIGALEGTTYSIMVPKQLPNAELAFFKMMSDMSVALEQGKIDAFTADEAYLYVLRWEGYDVRRVKEAIGISNYGVAFPKNGESERYRQEINAFIARSNADGTLKELEKKWFGNQEPTEFIDYSRLKGENGTLTVGVSSLNKPFVYMKNGELAGFDIELLTMFAEEYGYALDFRDTDFAGLLTGAQSKYDMAAAGLTITDERLETLDFSNPYLVKDLVYITEASHVQASFGEWLSDSFEKTFVKEDRWKMIAESIGITLIISICSTILGSVAGFVLYLLRRSKLPAVVKGTKAFARVYTRIVAGTPMVVILMILFYIVFGKADLNGVLVSIIAFTFTFGAFVYENLLVSVEGIDKGQEEAAYALGYDRNRTFFRIIFPQALKTFLPVYSGEVVSLVQGTSIVGYIAVSDLTAVGDIIRSNTYEAFFPLITTAVIYFILTWIFASLLGRIRVQLDPKMRRKDIILKGVKTS